MAVDILGPVWQLEPTATTIVLTVSAAGWLVSTGAYLYVIFGNAKKK